VASASRPYIQLILAVPDHHHNHFSAFLKKDNSRNLTTPLHFKSDSKHLNLDEISKKTFRYRPIKPHPFQSIFRNCPLQPRLADI
jgi:hypothetical protein